MASAGKGVNGPSVVEEGAGASEDERPGVLPRMEGWDAELQEAVDREHRLWLRSLPQLPLPQIRDKRAPQPAIAPILVRPESVSFRDALEGAFGRRDAVGASALLAAELARQGTRVENPPNDTRAGRHTEGHLQTQSPSAESEALSEASPQDSGIKASAGIAAAPEPVAPALVDVSALLQLCLRQKDLRRAFALASMLPPRSDVQLALVHAATEKDKLLQGSSSSTVAWAERSIRGQGMQDEPALLAALVEAYSSVGDLASALATWQELSGPSPSSLPVDVACSAVSLCLEGAASGAQSLLSGPSSGCARRQAGTRSDLSHPK